MESVRSLIRKADKPYQSRRAACGAKLPFTGMSVPWGRNGHATSAGRGHSKRTIRISRAGQALRPMTKCYLKWQCQVDGMRRREFIAGLGITDVGTFARVRSWLFSDRFSECVMAGRERGATG
jgi:hypothetical protein